MWSESLLNHSALDLRDFSERPAPERESSANAFVRDQIRGLGFRIVVQGQLENGLKSHVTVECRVINYQPVECVMTFLHGDDHT